MIFVIEPMAAILCIIYNAHDDLKNRLFKSLTLDVFGSFTYKLEVFSLISCISAYQ